MAEPANLGPGQILTGPLFDEPMRVEAVRPPSRDAWVVGLVGLQSERFCSVTLASVDLKTLPANALRSLLKAEQERGPDFVQLANPLWALYPKDSEEKRLLAAMLLVVPR